MAADQARFYSLRRSPTGPDARAPRRRRTAPDGPPAHNRRPPPARVVSDQSSTVENVGSCRDGTDPRRSSSSCVGRLSRSFPLPTDQVARVRYALRSGSTERITPAAPRARFIYPRSIPILTGPAPSRARSLPNWISRAAIEFREPEPPESVFEKGKARRLRSSNRLADFLKILAVQFNQVGERFRVP